jgi:hypothetical protein
MRPFSRGRLVAGLVSAAGTAMLALGVLSGGALAAPNPGPPLTSNPAGPQSANIPYVAWVGEHVRLVACDPAINAEGNTQFLNYQIEDWSGYQFQPPNPDGDAGNNLNEAFNPGPAAFFTSSEPAHEVLSGGERLGPDGCVATDYKSLNPGLARIRVVVRNQATRAIVFSHQFLVIWLTANAPTLHEAGVTAGGSEVFQSALNSSGKSNLASYLGDPSGDGNFTPTPFAYDPSHLDKGLVQIRVTGSFPVVGESPLSNILGSSSYTLPSDWATLAGVLASSSEEDEPPGSEPALWDIHGTPGAAAEAEETKVEVAGDPTEVCTSGNPGVNSSTDNCNGEEGESPLTSKFSRVFGDLTSGETATVGPFDPQAANETLLSDGRLNQDDAPMPALRVDVSIAKNEGGLGGVGQISEADKAMIYSHDFTGSSAAHNLYNPYYGAYIPATDRPNVNEVSGVDGPSPGGDFPGFLNEHPDAYPFWTSVRSANYRTSKSTGCLRREDSEPSEYVTPSGPLTETFYTDERGEAYVTYTPGNQFYLEHLVSTVEEEGRIIKNADGGCDLKGVHEKVIGESAISAKAVYPYQSVDYPRTGESLTSSPLLKRVNSLWEKEFFQFPKGPGLSERSVRIVVAKAQDIDGSPFAGETLCFFAQGGGVSQFTGKWLADPSHKLGRVEEPVYVGGSIVVHPVGQEGKFCETTNQNGLAAIEVTNSTGAPVDLNVSYLQENIFRDHDVSFAPEENLKPKEEVLAAQTPSTTTTTQTALTTVASLPLATGGVAGTAVVKPLTLSQKLHAALKACKKKPRKARIACERKARKAYDANRKQAAKAPVAAQAPPKVGLG